MVQNLSGSGLFWQLCSICPAGQLADIVDVLGWKRLQRNHHAAAFAHPDSFPYRAVLRWTMRSTGMWQSNHEIDNHSWEVPLVAVIPFHLPHLPYEYAFRQRNAKMLCKQISRGRHKTQLLVLFCQAWKPKIGNCQPWCRCRESGDCGSLQWEPLLQHFLQYLVLQKIQLGQKSGNRGASSGVAHAMAEPGDAIGRVQVNAQQSVSTHDLLHSAGFLLHILLPDQPIWISLYESLIGLNTEPN